MTDADVRKLQEIYARLPNDDCDGCDGCGAKCAGDIPMTRWEFEQIRAFVGGLQSQAPEGDRPSSPFGSACQFLDAAAGLCRVYPVRPLICRLFGLVEWLPCPLGRWGVRVPDGWDIIAWYAAFDRRPFGAWLNEARATRPHTVVG